MATQLLLMGCGDAGASSADLWNNEASLWDGAAFTWN